MLTIGSESRSSFRRYLVGTADDAEFGLPRQDTYPMDREIDS
jgi:hypothetical protein